LAYRCLPCEGDAGPALFQRRCRLQTMDRRSRGRLCDYPKKGKELDVVAGVRIWNVKNDLTFFRQNIEADFGRGTRSGADPVVGANFSSDLPHKMFVFAKVTLGVLTSVLIWTGKLLGAPDSNSTTELWDLSATAIFRSMTNP